MHYYIDGYNLLFCLKSTHNRFKESREELIDELCEKLNFINLDVTIVFDSIYQAGESTRGHKQNLEIQYTAEGETADEFIISEVGESIASQEIVITSDKKLAWTVRNLGAKTQSVSEFMAWLNKAWKNKIHKGNNTIQSNRPIIIPPKKIEIMTDEQRWLKIFEERTVSVEESTLKFKKPVIIKVKPEENELEDSGINDEERWLKIFEARINKPDE